MILRVKNKLNQLDLNDKELAKYYEINHNFFEIKEDTPIEIKIEIGYRIFDFKDIPKERFMDVLINSKTKKDIKRALKYKLRLSDIQKQYWEDYWSNKPIIVVDKKIHLFEVETIKYYEKLAKKINEDNWEFWEDEEKSKNQQTFWYYIFFSGKPYKSYRQLTLRVDYLKNEIELVPYKKHCKKHIHIGFMLATEEELSKCCEIPIIKLTNVDWQKIDFNKDIKPHIDKFFKELLK